MNANVQNEWQVVGVVILKDEAAYIENWLLFHLGIGFEHIFIYDNGSSDRIREVLEKYICGGVVTYISWPLRAGQIDAYNHALRLLGHKTEWMGFFDVDEYIVLHNHETIGQYVASLDADQILLPWRNFPYGGHKLTPGGSDLENYVWAHKAAAPTAVQVKHLVRAATALHATAHFSFISTDKTVLADGTPSTFTHIIDNPSYKGAQINHYSTRSFIDNELRLRKGQVDGGAEKKVAHFVPLNNETAPNLDYDISILRHFWAFSQERSRWAHLAAKPHRFGLMQRKAILSSWNNVPYFFCKSYLNYLAGASEISHGTSLEPVHVDASGKEINLRVFWANQDLDSVHFRVDQDSFMPFFMGSVHYGDFVRRFSYEARFIARELDVQDIWKFDLDCGSCCFAAIFDLESHNGVRITAELGGEVVEDYFVPNGHHAGIIYRPVYLLENSKIQYKINGACRIKEIILGVLP